MDVRGEKQWLTAAEAAAEALPGFEFDERHIRRIIATGNLDARSRKTNAGRPSREFHWTSLPPDAKAEYLKRHAIAAHADDGRDDPKTRDAARDLQAEARALIAGAVTAFLADRNLPVQKGLKTFTALYARRKIKLDDWVFAAEPAVTPSRLRTWRRIVANDGPRALRDGRGRPGGSGIFDTDLALRNYAIAAIAARPHLAATHLRNLISADLAREIPLRTVQHFLRGLRKANAPLLKALNNPDQFRSHHQPAFGSRTRHITRINQQWQIDASPADAMCIVNGRPMRFKLTALIDVFTRRVRVLVSDQARSIATMALVRRAVRDFGLPECLKVDNGKEFKSRSVAAFCHDLNIDVNFSRPFTPEEKAHIERFFGTLNRDLFELLPGYIGHNVAQRNAIENRKSFSHRFGENAELAFEVAMSPEGLQARIDAWVENIYHQRSHSGIGMPPFAKALAHADEAKMLADDRALDSLLLSVPGNGGVRIVAKKGIAVFGRHYVAPELIPGYPVSVRHDPTDPAHIVVYSGDGLTFLCIATDPAALSDAELIELSAKAKANTRGFVRAARDASRKVQRLYPAAGAADRLLNAANTGPDLCDDARDAMIAAHPPRLLEHARALDEARTEQQPIEPTADERESAALYLAEFAAKPAPAGTVQCDGYVRPFFEDDCDFVLWTRGWRAAGNALDAEDAAAVARLEASETFQLELNSRTRAANA